MAWIYLAASEESAKPWLPGSELSPTVKESDTLKPSYFQEWSEEKSKPPQSGMTLQRSQPGTSQELTSSAEDSPARTYPSQGLELAWQESEAAYFLKSYGLHASYNRDSCSWRMSQEFLPGIHLEQSEERWPRWAMIVGGECYRLTMWERRTKGKDGSVWPTPQVLGNDLNWEATDGRTKPNKLGWAVRIWPTHQATDWKRAGQPHGFNQMDLPVAAGGKLNPTWVEWLMGYQCETTALSALATEWFRSKSGKLSKSWSESKPKGEREGE